MDGITETLANDATATPIVTSGRQVSPSRKVRVGEGELAIRIPLLYVYMKGERNLARN